MHIINNYRELLDSDKPLLFFDLETTGLSRDRDRIIEIGAIKVTDGIITDEIDCLVNPGIPVPYYATKVNGITSKMLEDKESDIHGVKKFISLATDSIVIAHNISFDAGFINSYLSRMNMPDLNNRLVDTVRFARKAFPNRKKYSLGEIALDLGIEVKQAHRAKDDARVCYELFVKCLEQIKSQEK